MKKNKLLPGILALIGLMVITAACTVPTSDDDDDNSLKIENIQVTNISESAVRIEWNTTDSTECDLYYGLTDYGNHKSDSVLSMEHTVTIYDLMPSSQYRYKIVAQTVTDRFVERENLRFETMADTIPPDITNIHLLSMTSSSITLSWETSEETSSLIKWGETIAYNGMKSSEYDNATVHYATVDGLDHLTGYHFKIEATDLSGNVGRSPDTVFATADLPVIKFVPDTIYGEVGDTIDVAVEIEVNDLAALAFLMEYDNLKIDILKVEQGAFFVENSGNIFQVENPLVTQVELIASWMINYEDALPVGTGADGTGNVCILKIELLREGESEINFIREDILPVGRPDGHPDSQLYDMTDSYMNAHWYNLYISAEEPEDDGL